jgi:hypothetical protein
MMGSIWEEGYLDDRERPGIISLRWIGCEGGRWIELAQNRVQWRVLIFAVLNIRVILQERQCGSIFQWLSTSTQLAFKNF